MIYKSVCMKVKNLKVKKKSWLSKFKKLSKNDKKKISEKVDWEVESKTWIEKKRVKNKKWKKKLKKSISSDLAWPSFSKVQNFFFCHFLKFKKSW